MKTFQGFVLKESCTLAVMAFALSKTRCRGEELGKRPKPRGGEMGVGSLAEHSLQCQGKGRVHARVR